MLLISRAESPMQLTSATDSRVVDRVGWHNHKKDVGPKHSFPTPWALLDLFQTHRLKLGWSGKHRTRSHRFCFCSLKCLEQLGSINFASYGREGGRCVGTSPLIMDSCDTPPLPTIM